jgi:hypothetical protein
MAIRSRAQQQQEPPHTLGRSVVVVVLIGSHG